MKKMITSVLLFSALVLNACGMERPVEHGYAVEKMDSVGIPFPFFLDLVLGDKNDRATARAVVEQRWELACVAPVLDVIPFLTNQEESKMLFDLLEKQTGEEFGYSTNAWYQWLWAQEYTTFDDYPEFKKQLYRLVDRKFEAYFDTKRKSLIRLDEVRWGGVLQDGIPPLHNPKMIPVAEADYLEDNNVVFGIEVNGDFRAYPKRILAWHEMFTDQIGGVPVAGVYCTLCGSMILYETEQGGTVHKMGTSGFLYRSNKLMYDHATQSLWNTILGSPVVGPLVDQGIELEVRPVVTTTWGVWRKQHPETKVLSLETGFKRDYAEGEAYREYFSTDDLMFNTPFTDSRLANKAEVVALRFGTEETPPMAIAADYLYDHPVYHNELGSQSFVILTDWSGASRVYETKGKRFKKWDRKTMATEENKTVWKVTEEALVNENGEQLRRLPAHRAFWFGWLAAHPKTQLIQ